MNTLSPRVYFTPVFGGQLSLLLDSNRNVFFCRVSGTLFPAKRIGSVQISCQLPFFMLSFSNGQSSCELVLDDGQTAISRSFDCLAFRSLEVTSMKSIVNNTYEISFSPQRCEISEVYCKRGGFVWKGRHNGCSSVTCFLPQSPVLGPSSLEISFDALLFSNSGFSAKVAGMHQSADSIGPNFPPVDQLKNLTLISVVPRAFFASFFKTTLTISTNAIIASEDISSCALEGLNATFVSTQLTQVSCTCDDTRGLKSNAVLSIVSPRFRTLNAISVLVKNAVFIRDTTPKTILTNTYTLLNIYVSMEGDSKNFLCRLNAGTTYPIVFSNLTFVACNVTVSMPGSVSAQIVDKSGNTIALGGSIVAALNPVLSSVILDISPASGNEADVVTVRGLGFPVYQSLCFFGGNAAAAVTASSDGTTVLCKVPSQPDVSSAAVQINVGVTTISGDAMVTSTQGVYFAYIPIPSVLYVQPSIGLDIGGLLVTVFGSNFVRGTGLQCRFGADAVCVRSVQLFEMINRVFRTTSR